MLSIAFSKVQEASTELHPTKTAPVSLQVILFWIRNNAQLQKPGDLLCNILFSRVSLSTITVRWGACTPYVETFLLDKNLRSTLIWNFSWFYSVTNHLLQQTLQINGSQCFVRQITAFYAPTYASGRTLPGCDSHPTLPFVTNHAVRTQNWSLP